ncbi:Endonuclease/exonuclease/phosphatase [Dichotomocladium elegans]|nr:Endonuclease/exonuclease/phosphatase [Dichotomocladium elegans]
MRILTWNINGLSTVLNYHPWCEKKTYEALLNALDADIICLQEIKCQRSRMTRAMALVPGYDGYFSFSKTKLGYSGVAIYVKDSIQPHWVEEGITGILNTTTTTTSNSNSTPMTTHIKGDIDTFLATRCVTDAGALDAEGRCIIMDLGGCVLLNVYFPNETNDGRRDFKMDYHACVRWRIDDFLLQGKQVILVGDTNAVHERIDHCDPEQSIREHGLKDFKDLPQRRWMDQLVAPKGPLVDVCRKYHPGRKGMFTCWNQRLNARPSNYGTRIDYILVSRQLEPYFQFADIRPDILGSDHCPAYADTANDDDLIYPAPCKSTSPLLGANFDEFSNRQKKISMFFSAKAATATTTISGNEAMLAPVQPSPPPSILSSAPTDNVVQRSASTTPKARQKRARSETPQKSQKTLRSSFFKCSSDVIGDKEEQREKEEDPIDISVLVAEAKEKQEAKHAWSSLFQANRVPVCSVHNEPCKLKTVTKKGPNQGRQFYCCSRSGYIN